MTAVTKSELLQMQSLPLHLKIHKTCARIQEWYDYHDGNIAVSLSGGVDSEVLIDMARRLYPKIPAVFSNTGLEMPEIVEFVRTFPNVIEVRPEHSFKWVVDNCGYPVVSKRVARYIRDCQNPTERNARSRQLRMTGISSVTQPGKYQASMKIPEKWKFLIDAPFKVSEKCCDWIKKKPLDKYLKANGLFAMTAEMADDSERRTQTYMMTGCNNYGGDHPKSMPMGFWTRQDVLAYIKVFNLPYCSVYGDIVCDPITKRLETTKEQRTGCMFCMFGVHMEKHPNRFERMKVSHPKHYAVCMNIGCGKVMDYIGVSH
jgi:3'-phosphoadenosine 5'-phosphosulfate sulfotransferase (PAPS reductase)/FAD synthetase